MPRPTNHPEFSNSSLEWRESPIINALIYTFILLSICSIPIIGIWYLDGDLGQLWPPILMLGVLSGSLSLASILFAQSQDLVTQIGSSWDVEQRKYECLIQDWKREVCGLTISQDLRAVANRSGTEKWLEAWWTEQESHIRKIGTGSVVGEAHRGGRRFAVIQLGSPYKIGRDLPFRSTIHAPKEFSNLNDRAKIRFPIANRGLCDATILIRFPEFAALSRPVVSRYRNGVKKTSELVAEDSDAGPRISLHVTGLRYRDILEVSWQWDGTSAAEPHETQCVDLT